ncbi:glycoside hydrolase family 13 protein [Bacillus massiliglaciei]|uniref:glycoside hydrolase family 13 protein n=1 Tax=Bacillus massiliglaciei TaxID=1816693 RepID=UPI000DA60067|nr:alpha-glucosidase [Bacillus massiliglaciei]
MKNEWWKEATVYQIYPRSFMDSNNDGIGDLKGIISKLDYLEQLGIDVIWLSPVYQSPNDDNGYDISDYYAIMSEFGTMKEFDELLAELHRRQMKLMMDLVVNHTSDEHKWFQSSRTSKTDPKRDYYIWKKGDNGKEPTNWESMFKGSAWEYDGETGEYYLHLFTKKQPDLNWENPEVREEIYKMMNWWLDKGVDGFRMDVINFISKDRSFRDGKVPKGKKYGDGSPYFKNGPKVHEYLQEMNRRVIEGRDIITVGETPGVTTEDAIKYTGDGRHELQMIFQFEHTEIGNDSHGKWSNEPWKLTDLKKILSKWQEDLAYDGWNSLYWNNHDQPRVVSRFGQDKEYRVESAKMLAACLHLMKGTPYIYQGEELGMTNVRFSSIEEYRDIETRNAYQDLVFESGWTEKEMMKAIHARSRDNARTPMQWDSTRHGGFTKGTPWIAVNPNYQSVNAKEAVSNPDSVFHFYRKLIELRKKYKVIVYGEYELLCPDDENIFAYTRTLDAEKLWVLCNFTEYEVPSPVANQERIDACRLLLSNYREDEEFISGALRPYECRVFLANK